MTPAPEHPSLEEIATTVGEAAQKLGRSCGDCSMCCKIMPVPVLNKSAHRWCSHAKPGQGCTIYEGRPMVCKAFACFWLITDLLGPQWKPTVSKMVVTSNSLEAGCPSLMIYPDRAYRDAWRKQPYYDQIKAHSENWRIEICVGDTRSVMVFPNADVEFNRKTEAVWCNRDGGYEVVDLGSLASRQG